MGMAINCTKSNILYCKDADLEIGTSLLSLDGDLLGSIKLAPKYKYLGVQVTTKSASGIFVEATKTCKQKLRSHAGIILGLTKNGFDPIKNGLTLWTDMAVVAALYGTEVIHFKQDINELE